MLRSGSGGRHKEVDGAAEGSPAISAYAVPTGTCQRPDSRSLLRGGGLQGSRPRPDTACREGTCGSSSVAPQTSQRPLLSPVGALIRCRRHPAVALGTAGPGYAAAAHKTARCPPRHSPPAWTPARRFGGPIPRRARLSGAGHEARPSEEAGCMSDTREQAGAGGDGVSVTVTKTGMIESLDVSQREDVPKLRKHAVGIWGVLFLTVTGSAPISAMLFNTPIVVGNGNGVGAPAAFIFATVVL